MAEEKSKTKRRMVVEEIEVPKKEESMSEEVKEETPKEDILETGASTEKVESDTPEKTEEVKEPEKKEEEKEEETSKPKKSISPVFWIIIPGIFILGAILGGIIFYQRGVNTTKVEPTPTPVTSTSATEPTSTPSATVDLEKYEVAVFNGSGTAGEAGKVQDILETAGFVVSSTGNAASYDYSDTIIKAKEDVDNAFIQKLTDTLSDTYVVGDTELLSASSDDSVQVIVGSSKAE